MSITYLGDAFSGTTTGPASSAVITVSGLGLQQNDVLIIAGGVNQSGAKTFPGGSASITDGTNTLNQLIPASNDGTCYWDVRYLVVGVTPPSTITVSGSNGRWTASVRAYRGANTASPFTAVSTTTVVASAPSPVSLSITGLTPGSGNTVVGFVVGGQQDNTVTLWTLTAPSGFGNVANDGNQTNEFTPVESSFDQANVSSTTGTLTGTWTSTAGASIGYGAWLMALNPAAAAPPSQAMSSVTGSSLATRF